jgi:ABC-type sulfate transport system substrate-binding protein
MAEYAGSAMVLRWVTTAGTVLLNTDFRTFAWTPSLNWIDATAGADTYEVLLPSYGVGAEIPVTLVAQTQGTTLIASLARQTAGSLVYYPAGTSTGNVYYTIPATSAGPQWSQSYNDVVTITANFRQSSVETLGTA